MDFIKYIRFNGYDYYNIDAGSAKKIGMTDVEFESHVSDQQSELLFESEKIIAVKILNDFNLGIGEHEITGSDMADVRAYIQSIDPSKGLKAGHLQRAKIPRPSIFDRYKKNPYEL